ncbi:MAG: PAS domain S-box protein [Candidatus Lernaella stagnicola]|nr:PAS domain S-box protein [Candidatus Lernaella stagnicola]
MNNAQLGETRRLFRIFDADPTPVLITDSQWIVLYANEAAVFLLETDASDLLQTKLNRLPQFQPLQSLFKQMDCSLQKADQFVSGRQWLDFAGRRAADIRVEKLGAFIDGEENLLWRIFVQTPYRPDAAMGSESAEMYRNLVEVASDGICIIQDEIVVYANPQLCAMVGWTALELLGMPFADHIDMDDVDKLRDLYSRHHGGARELGVIPIRVLHRDGTVVDVEIDGSIIPYKGKPATLVTLRDVTETLAAKRALERSEGRYRQVTESTTDIIWSYDLAEQCFSFFSNAAESILGYSPETDEHITLLHILPRDHADWVANQFEELIAQWPERDTLAFELQHYRKDRTKVWLEVNGRLVAEGTTDRPTMVVGVSRDVTDRHEAARQLVESEGRYRRLVTLVPELICVVQDGQFKFINEGGARILGAESPDELTGVDNERFVHPSYLEAVKKRTKKLIDEETETDVYTYLCRRLDGSDVYLETASIPFQFENRPALLSVGRDVTAHRHAAEALNYRMRLLKLITQITTRFIALDPEETDRAIEEALEEIGTFVGADRGYIYQYRAGGHVADNTHEWARDVLQRVKIDQQNVPIREEFPWWTESFSGEGIFLCRDIEELPPEADAEKELFRVQQVKSMAIVPLTYGDKVTGFFGFDDTKARRDWDEEAIALLRIAGVAFTNALTHKRANAALRESEETALSLLNATDALAVLTDRDGTILAVNEITAKILQCSADDLIRTDSLQALPERWHEQAKEIRRQVLADGKPYRNQHRIYGRWYLVNVQPVIDESGVVRRLSVYARDIHDLKRQEEELLEALRKAQEAELLKTRFLANMSHEIRTPLNHIIGLASVLLIQPDISAEEREGYLKIIKRGGQSMLELLTAILDLSKIESGRLEPKHTPFHVREWLEQQTERYSLQAGAKGLKFRSYCEDSVPGVVASDPVKIGQVLGNLVDNALKFTREGSVEVHLEGKPHEKGGWELIFRVVDTGIGIEPDKLTRVFDSFYQADDSSTREFRGAGLGLTISRELVRMLGGQIKVISKPGQGCTFTFTCHALSAREAD